MTRPIRKVTSNSPSMVKASEASSRPPLNRVEREESQALLPPEMEPVRLIGIRLLRHGPIVDRRHGAAGHQDLDALAEPGLPDSSELDPDRAPGRVLALDLAVHTSPP